MVKFDKMTDGSAEIIRDSLNEFDDRIMERKISKQVIESLGSTDNMSSVEENTPPVSPDWDATGGAVASVQGAEIAEARMAEVDETPGNSKITDRDGKGRGEEHYFQIQQNNDNEEKKRTPLETKDKSIGFIKVT